MSKFSGELGMLVRVCRYPANTLPFSIFGAVTVLATL